MTIYCSHPADDPNGIVLRLWSPDGQRHALEVTEAELTDIEEAVAWVRARLATRGLVAYETVVPRTPEEQA